MRGFSARVFTRLGGRTRPFDRASAARAAAIVLLIAPEARADNGLQVLEEPPASVLSLASLEANVAGLALIVLIALTLLVAAAVALYLIGRRTWIRRVNELEAKLAQTTARLDRSTMILQGEPQMLISWDRPDAEPVIEGDLSIIADATLGPRRLESAEWLEPTFAAQVEEATERLLKRGEAFSIGAVSRRGRHLEISGQPISGSAVMRIRDVSGDRLQLARLHKTFAEAEGELTALRLALESASMPAWRRDAEGRLVWRNAPYSRAVEAPDDRPAVDNGGELFDLALRREAAAALKETGVWKRRAVAVVNGERRTFDAAEVRTAFGTAGVARDVSELAALRAEMERNEDDYSRMIDRLSTAVAIFDKSKRLTIYNAAYRQIWSLEPAFLDQRPTDGEILDQLRAKRQLPEQADFPTWKAQQMTAYQAIEPSETVWHLPDGRALRVVTSPNPKGGVTYLYDDATQSYALASQVNALTQVQGETLDALKEGVAVFGADGRMKLFNPVFAEMWRFDAATLRDRPHIDEIADACRALCLDPPLWDDLRSMVVALSERRESRTARIARTDELILECAALPLPDGATLLTSLDVTAGANFERALTERNEALVAAEKLRNDFVNHVSYELRTPLTNIIGFTQLLAAGGVGPLNPKQLEYAGFITNSSHALLAIIDDILDLASIDAGALELRLETVDVAEAMKAAAAGVQDRLDEAAIEMRIVMTDGVGALRADGRRVRQVLFNLLSNAINYSEPGQTVTLAAMRRGAEIIFKVSDRGRGIPPDMIDRVFDRFETFPNGSRHRGPGLGLSIVKALVELHQGRVLIDTAPNEGTTVTCIFPIEPTLAAAGADDGGCAARLAPQSAQ
ncbi:MAG TPA: ATP-binding protein [Roseiarcus sp.]|nr:ATP-binding protein [Roseiarcus sp.]